VYREGKSRGFIEEQDYTIEFAFADAAGERKPDGMKEFSAPKPQSVLQRVDDFLESVRGERCAIEQEKCEMAEHIAGGVAREDGVSLDFGEEFVCVVLKDEMQKIGERVAVRHVWTEQCGRAFAPRELLGRGLA
jgi:hypothetical protein